jgi:hypothetical protein
MFSRLLEQPRMIEKLSQDFGLANFGLDLIDPSQARRTSKQMLTHMTKDAFNTVTYLTPWIFVATYKVLEVIHESTRNRLPVTFQKHTVLLELCETLRESFRRPRNKIVHGGEYEMKAFPYKEMGKTFYDNCLALYDKHHRRVIIISLYDVTSAGFFVSQLAEAIRRRRISGSNLKGAYDDIQAPFYRGWIEEEVQGRDIQGAGDEEGEHAASC